MYLWLITYVIIIKRLLVQGAGHTHSRCGAKWLQTKSHLSETLCVPEFGASQVSCQETLHQKVHREFSERETPFWVANFDIIET